MTVNNNLISNLSSVVLPNGRRVYIRNGRLAQNARMMYSPEGKVVYVGGSFWSDFKNSFVKTFRKTYGVLAPIASAIVPEAAPIINAIKSVTGSGKMSGGAMPIKVPKNKRPKKAVKASTKKVVKTSTKKKVVKSKKSTDSSEKSNDEISNIVFKKLNKIF